MTPLRVLLSRLSGLFRKGSLERDIDDELAFHLQMETAENLRRGMTPEVARSTALRRFGGVTQMKETYRDTHSLPAIEVLWQDLRYGFRMLWNRPVFTGVAVVSLAFGIGANTAIFSVVDALLLKPLPYPDPDRLAVLWTRSPGVNTPQDWPSPGQYADIRTQNHSFEELSISRGMSGTLVGRDQPERIEALLTSSNLFQMLGARPLLGRLLLHEDDMPGKPAVVILSFGIWKRLFGSDPNIVGKSIVINGLIDHGLGAGEGTEKNRYTVAGVVGPQFMLNDEVMPPLGGLRSMEVFLPLPLDAFVGNRRGDESFNVMGRLNRGVTMRQAQADISVIADRIREQDKRDKSFTISVVPLADQVVGGVRRAVLVLLGSVTLVLLIACANVTNLLLARATGRRKEVAIRAAIGAGRQRLIRQLLTESVLLALIGGVAGLVIAEWTLYIVRTVHPAGIPRLDAIRIDGGVLAFTFGVSVLTGLVFGLAPALRAGKVDLNLALKAGGRSMQGDGGLHDSRHGLRSLLVVSEVAFSLMLLIGAGLLLRSFVHLKDVPPGFKPDHVTSMRVGASNRFPELGQRISGLPGVRILGEVSAPPFTSSGGWGTIQVEGFRPQPGQGLQVDKRSATVDYFRTMEIPLLRGRVFDEHDTERNAPPVAVIDEKFARRFWPNDDPIGKHVWQNPARPITIVGVVGVVKQYGLDIDGRMAVYLPAAGSEYLVVRTLSDPRAAARAIVQEIRAFDPAVLVYDIRTMQDRMNDSLARQRFSTIMLGAFAAFALILAAVGVYGVMSYLVAQSTHEIGVRIALGAPRGSIVRRVLRNGVELAGAGIVSGLIGAAALTRVMASLLFGVSPTDMVTFSVVPPILAAVALLAMYLPALRATRVDPVTALREE